MENTTQMEKTEILLKSHTDMEKGAYLGAIASIATADHVATEDEQKYLSELAASADLSDSQTEAVLRASTELTGEELERCLDVLKTSDLRFSLITDLISFAETDKNYSTEEKANIEKIAKFLNINEQQYSLLDQFVKKTNEQDVPAEQVSQPGFLSSLGLDQKFKDAGINIGSVTKGLLGVVGPMILAGLVSRGLRGRSSSGSNLGGSGFGTGGGGGLGSIISMLNGGRGFSSTDGLLSRIFGRR